MMNVIESLKWRTAIKKFDSTRKVKDEDLEQLLNAANLTPTSGGFQPFKLIVVGEGDVKNELGKHTYSQPQVNDAPQVLIFAIDTNVGDHTVDNFMKRMADVRNQDLESLSGYSNSMKGYLGGMDTVAKEVWAKTQAFIALGTVLTVAAEIRVDSCPMEGFDADKFSEILDLESKNLKPVVIVPIGYRSADDVYSKAVKVRKTMEELVIKIN